MRAQIHLLGKATREDKLGGCSGRAVRYKRLSPSERDSVVDTAAALVGKDATMFGLLTAERKAGIKSMITHVTRDPVEDMMTAPETAWEAVSYASLDAPQSSMAYSKIFTSKDDTILARLYGQLHDASADEVEAIMGKAVPLAEG